MLALLRFRGLLNPVKHPAARLDKGMSRIARVLLTVTMSILALAVAAGAIVAGVIESGRSGSVEAAATTAAHIPEVEATLRFHPDSLPSYAIRPCHPADGAESGASHPAGNPPAAAASPKTFSTVQARPPALQSPAKAPAVCPAGTVTSGLTDVTVQNEHYWLSGQEFTMMDIIGHGNIHNGTTAPVKVTISVPWVKGLDVNGRQTLINFKGDFNYAPPPGVPRP
ncbi:hypothetical protein PJ267_09230 [Arthrobacter sp. OVS8]|nr:hypothetical protein PJ267_09230 [Arthrobacter sp. OVS8]